MNWIIRNTKKIKFHTNLSETLKPILENIENYNWFLCDLDFMSDKSLPINFDEDYFKLNNEEFLKIVNSETQIIWGVISAIPKNIEIDENNLPFVEGNELIWKNDNFQVKNSVIEIIAFDSSYTIVKFKNHILSEKFKAYFDDAIELEKFK
ncbi:hypothetical protein [Flavobacterium sp. H122]|uniref:hypothetical protein n=1 Tax=Flavobacterium sp. H122 TaxID=2529860 RepID=UPI0010A9CE63|nr:hypothetical protein [Flavobacterium sp. H122]